MDPVLTCGAYLKVVHYSFEPGAKPASPRFSHATDASQSVHMCSRHLPDTSLAWTRAGVNLCWRCEGAISRLRRPVHTHVHTKIFYRGGCQMSALCLLSAPLCFRSSKQAFTWTQTLKTG